MKGMFDRGLGGRLVGYVFGGLIAFWFIYLLFLLMKISGGG